MDEKAQAAKEQLETLELAAEEASQPEDIQRKAEQPPSTRSGRTFFWLIPYLAIAALAGAGILLLEWKPLLSDPLSAKLQRYLLGVLGSVGVLIVARGLELFVIARLRN